jgi:hypothetical protein
MVASNDNKEVVHSDSGELLLLLLLLTLIHEKQNTTSCVISVCTTYTSQFKSFFGI